MTTATHSSQPATAGVRTPAAVRGKVTQLHVIRSEWTKLWSVRSTRYTFLFAIIAMMIGIGIAVAQMNRWSSMEPGQRANYNSIDNGVGGWHLAQLAIAVLGVIVVTGEYTTGMIRSSMMAVPRRLPVLWAKLIVYCASAFAIMLAATLVSFFGVQAVVTGHHLQHSLGDPHALRAVIGTALFMTVLGALGIGIGTLVRNTAGGISALVGILFVLPGVAALLPSSWGDTINPYLPINAATTVATVNFDPGSHHLSTWGGFAVICLYAAIAIALAAVQLVRRDA